MAAPSFSIVSATDPETELKTRLRDGLTGYEDHKDDLPAAQLDSVLATAKSKIYTDIGVDEFYADHFKAELLLYTTAILAKSRVENYAVKRWSVGDAAITVPDADREDSLQLEAWNDAINDSLEEIDEASSDKLQFKISSNYGWGRK